MKSEPSPCKGQGDEFGNTVLSPHNFTSSFMKTDYDTVENVKQGLTPENLNNSSALTYTTLYPNQDKQEVVVLLFFFLLLLIIISIIFHHILLYNLHFG